MENELKKLIHVPSRIGRDLQRYHSGRRQVVGCIPYRLMINNFSSSINEEIEVLMVSSQKGEAMLFPKGGWEEDESMQEAALRECLEEAGVLGTLQNRLGQWTYKSKSQDKQHDGYMFPLLVEEELDFWPEKGFRQRKWVTVSEAKKLCPQKWMIEALESLVRRLTDEKIHAINNVSSTPCCPQTVSWLYRYYLQTPCRVSSCINLEKSINSQHHHLLRRAKTEIIPSCRNSAATSSYLHRLNRCSTTETRVLLDRSNREGLSENFGIDSKLPSMVEQK